MYTEPISVLKKGIFLGKRAWSNTFSRGFAPRSPFLGVILVILDAEIVYYICKLGTNVGRKDQISGGL